MPGQKDASNERSSHGGGGFESRWSEARLDGMRDSGDPLADETIAAILARGDRELANLIMRTLHRPDQWPAHTPPEVKRYLEISELYPTGRTAPN